MMNWLRPASRPAMRLSTSRSWPPRSSLLRGDELWCQGFSEPDAGSDLVAMRTSATLDGDEYVIRGHKIWTSWALYAQRCVVLARTGRPSPRHRGLSGFF